MRIPSRACHTLQKYSNVALSLTFSEICCMSLTRFVTLGPMKRQQDMVDMLLSLRSMKICDKPIKARLKTQRMVVNKHSSPIESLVPSSSGYNPYRTWNRNKSAGGSFKGHSNQIYAGDRVYYSGKKNFEKGRGSGATGCFN